MILYRITLSYACFGIETNNKIVIFTAPIGKWMIGKNIEFIKNWVKRKKGKIEQLTTLNYIENN